MGIESFPGHCFEGERGATCEYRAEDGEKCGRVQGDKRHLGYAPQYMQPKPIDLGPGKIAFPETFSVQGQQPEQFWPRSALAVWQGHADAVLALLKKKQAYGDSWKTQGYMGNIGRILSKCDRLRNMTWRDDAYGVGGGDDNTPEEESVLDTLYDLSALCAFAIANLEDGNRWGR